MANIDDLSNEIARELQRYANVIEEDMEVAKEEVADNLVGELKQKALKIQVGIVKVGEKEGWERNYCS